MTQSTNVLCVLQDDYRKEYEPELARLRQTGANFVFESSPEKSLTMVGEIDPKLVIVGTEIGTMEGIEFLAMLTSQYPAFGGSVVVLSEKADGMPPVVHSRAQSTGRSAVEGMDFEQIASLIAGPAPEPRVEPEPEPAPEPPSARPTRPKWLVPAIAAVGVLIFIVVGYLVFAGGGEAEQNSGSDPGSQVAGAVPEADPVKEPVGEPAGEPAVEPVKEPEKEPLATVDQPAEEPDPPIEPPAEEHANLPEKFVLPLTFDEGVGRPRISDRDSFDGIVSSLKEQSGLKIELIGHTSAPGEVRNNYRLGLLRARMTKKLLVRRGISPRRVKVKSRGEREPVDSGGGSSSNRRVEARIIP